MAQQQAQPQATIQRASLIDMVLYGFGGIAGNIPFIVMGQYLSFFYTDIFGLAPAIVSVIMFVSKIVDAVIDPLIGIVADHTVTKWGRFRPFVIFAAPLTGVMIWLVFTTPAFDDGTKAIYAGAMYILYVIISSTAIIPNNSTAQLMSGDPKQRATVQTFKQGFSLIPQLMTSLALPIVAALGGGQTGWSNYGILMGVATCICFWISAYGARKYDTEKLARTNVTEKETDGKKQSIGDILHDVSTVFHNRQMLLLIGSFCTEMTATTLGNSVGMYYCTYVLGHQEWMVAFGLVGIPTGIVSALIIPFIVQRFGKKFLFSVFVAFSILPNALMLFVTPSYELLLIVAASYSFASRVVGTLAWSMIPDVVDYGEITTGVRSNGLTQSSVQLMNQLGQAIGGALPVAIIGMLGYVAGQQQTETVLAAIVFFRWGVPCILHAISFVCMHFYKLTDEVALANSQELARRRAEVEAQLEK